MFLDVGYAVVVWSLCTPSPDPPSGADDEILSRHAVAYSAM
ncbi:MAG: hypothetical protein ACRDS0_06810 [Pseudonocardiaceae bacterium]